MGRIAMGGAATPVPSAPVPYQSCTVPPLCRTGIGRFTGIRRNAVIAGCADAAQAQSPGSARARFRLRAKAGSAVGPATIGPAWAGSQAAKP